MIDTFVTDTQTKANIFNHFFAEQCPLLKNDSVLPTNQMFLTPSRLHSLDFNEDIIRALNIHKAHGYHDISIRMIKKCDKSLVKSLILLVENSTNHHVTQIYGKDLILYRYIKAVTKN